MLYIATDHRGLKLKQDLCDRLLKKGIKVEDLGTFDGERTDYPIFCKKLCEKVVKDEKNRGILICYTGIGMSICANKQNGIRAGLCVNSKMSELARSDDDINVLVLPAMKKCTCAHMKTIKAFLETKFKGGKYQERIDMMK